MDGRRQPARPIAADADASATLDVAALRSVSKDEFDRVWSIYSHLQEAEQHVNDLQSHYRTLASTWLLATFGAAGFLLSNPPEALPIAAALVAAVVCVVGAVGIALLWNLDLMVYQGILRARFYVGREMEVDLPWLPPIRRRILAANRSGTTPRVATFYVAATAVPLLFGAVLIAFWVDDARPELLIPVVLASLAVVVGVPAIIARASGIRPGDRAARPAADVADDQPHQR